MNTTVGKTSYLQRRNRRVDRLMYILINDVEEDFISNINHIRMNVEEWGLKQEKREEGSLKLKKSAFMWQWTGFLRWKELACTIFSRSTMQTKLMKFVLKVIR
jgi:hypothetical protein